MMPTTETELITPGGKLTVKITANGYKSSEGDGRTAADIERELEEAALAKRKAEECENGTE